MTRKLLAIDFDDTLTNGNAKWWKGEEAEPKKEILKWLDKEYIKGHIIIIHSARPWSVAKDTEAWLMKHGVRFHGLRFGKLSADLYVDDKAINVRDIT